MIKHTVKTIAEKLERLGTNWAECKLAWYSIYTHRPYWAVKVPVYSSAGTDWLTFNLDHRSVDAVQARIKKANDGRITCSFLSVAEPVVPDA